MNNIGWCHGTQNWQAGCSPASAGCERCWALRMTRRHVCNPMAPERYGQALLGADGWSGEIRYDPQAMRLGFLRINATRKPLRWFLGSMSDLWHPNAPEQALVDLSSAILWHRDQREGAEQTIILSTKRPARLLEWQRRYFPNGLPANVWCLLSVCNQHDAEEKMSEFLCVKATVLGAQVEPMLGPLDLAHINRDDGHGWTMVDNALDGFVAAQCGGCYGPHLSLAIIGPETGPGARPYDPAWGRDLAQQCADAGVKVWGKAGSGIERQELPHAR